MRLPNHKIHLDPLDPTSPVVAQAHTANVATAFSVLACDPDDENGRSQLMWIRFTDGTLALAVFPQGDTYFAVEADAETPAELMSEPNRNGTGDKDEAVRAAAKTAIDTIHTALVEGLAERLTCTEIDAVADLYRALGEDTSGLLAAHADTEPCDHDHHDPDPH